MTRGKVPSGSTTLMRLTSISSKLTFLVSGPGECGGDGVEERGSDHAGIDGQKTVAGECFHSSNIVRRPGRPIENRPQVTNLPYNVEVLRRFFTVLAFVFTLASAQPIDRVKIDAAAHKPMHAWVVPGAPV